VSLFQLNNFKLFFFLDLITQISGELKLNSKNESADVSDILDNDKKESSNIIKNEIIELLAAQNKKIDDTQKHLHSKLNGNIDKINHLVTLLEETINCPISSDFFEKTLAKQDQIAESLKNIISQKDEQ
jgi:hypothetical protein